MPHHPRPLEPARQTPQPHPARHIPPTAHMPTLPASARQPHRVSIAPSVSHQPALRLLRAIPAHVQWLCASPHTPATPRHHTSAAVIDVPRIPAAAIMDSRGRYRCRLLRRAPFPATPSKTDSGHICAPCITFSLPLALFLPPPRVTTNIA